MNRREMLKGVVVVAGVTAMEQTPLRAAATDAVPEARLEMGYTAPTR